MLMYQGAMAGTSIETFADLLVTPERTTPIGLLLPRVRAAVDGAVAQVRVTRRNRLPVLQLELVDVTGSMPLVFIGRARLGGVQVGTRLTAAGAVGRRDGRLMMMNPQIWLHAPMDSFSSLVLATRV